MRADVERVGIKNEKNSKVSPAKSRWRVFQPEVVTVTVTAGRRTTRGRGS